MNPVFGLIILRIFFDEINLSRGESPDPDIGRTTCQIVIARGFGCEIHYVTTYQNYIVELHRVPARRPNPYLKPVILQTGGIGTSADFIMASNDVSMDTDEIGPNMGLELSKQGYDVWLSNNRGSIYGLNHTILTPNNWSFWKFSFDEISKYDIPAIIDFVLRTTGKDKLHYIGHSQGTSVMFALLSQTNRYNEVIQSFIAISPIAKIGLATTSLRFMIAGLKPILLTGGAVFTKNPLTSTLIPLACGVEVVNLFCESVFFSVVGPNYAQLDLERLPVYLSKLPTSTSAKNLLHYHQMFNSNQFRMYDYGLLLNPFYYGRFTAPIYDLTKITHPHMTIIYGRNDWWVTANFPGTGVEALRDALPNDTEFYEIYDPKANHMDPLIGTTDAVEVTRKVIDVLRRFAQDGE